MTDCLDRLFEVAVELPKCTTDLECLGLCADSLFENLPDICVVRYVHPRLAGQPLSQAYIQYCYLFS